jgi:hypothetical protein
MFVHLTVWCHFPFVLPAGTLKCLLRDERDGTNWELPAVRRGTARLEHLLADSCSIAYVFSEMNMEVVRWGWDTRSSCANRRQERFHQHLRHCNVLLAKPFLQLAERKCGTCNVCKNSCLIPQDIVLSLHYFLPFCVFPILLCYFLHILVFLSVRHKICGISVELFNTYFFIRKF